MKTKEEFFRFEKEQRRFFDDYYRGKRWGCQRINGKENKRYDCLIFIGTREIKIQEKVRSEDYGDFLVELIRDTNTGDKGWLYTCEADYILYKTPKNFYWIDRQKLKNHMEKFGVDYKTIESIKGWGRTINAIIPWKIIIENKIGGRIDANNMPTLAY
jgi:hypothetical protein